MNEIEKPGKGTKIRETIRLTGEAGMSFFPGGSLLNSFSRWLIPSKLDKQKVAWEDNITQATNQQGDDVKGLQDETQTLRLEQSDLAERLDDTRDHVDELVRKVDIGIVEIDPLDGELEICRDLVLSAKYKTALDLLRDRFDDPKRSNQISSKLMARVRSLQGMCLKNLGQYEEASKHFLQALTIDPNSPKIRANAAVGYMIANQYVDAEALIDGLLGEEPDASMHWANKVYVKSAQGTVMDVSEFPKVVRQSKDVCIALVDAMRANGDESWLEEAGICVALHPDSVRAKRHAAEASLETAITAHVKDLDDPAAVTQSIQNAKAASEELATQWQAHLQTESADTYPDIALLQNTIVAYRLVNNREEAESLITANIDLLLSDDRTKTLVGVFALNMNNDDLLDQVLSTEFAGDKTLRIERALQKQDWETTLEILELYPDELAPSSQIDPTYMGDVLRVMLGPDDEKLDGLREVFERAKPEDGHYDLFLCQMAAKVGLADLSKQIFERAITCDLQDDAELRRALASEAMERDIPDTVIELLCDHVDPSRDSRERNWLAVSYARSSVPKEAGIAFFADVRKFGDKDADVNRAGGHFHLNRRQPDEAVPWFKRSLAVEPNNVRTQLAYWQALSRHGATKRAQEFLAQVDLNRLDGPNSDLMSMAQLLWRSGRTDALEYAYELAARNRNDFQVCLTYSGLMLGDAFEKDVAPIPTPQKVGVGAMVRLSRPHNDDWSIIVTEDESDIPSHVSVNNAIVKAALGKRVGDQFETTSGPNTFVWTIAEIKSKYLHLFHEITPTLEEQFPDNGSFYSMTVVDDDITPILESLRERRSYIETLEEKYRDNPMSLGMMAKAGGGGTVDFAIHLARSGQKIFSATGLSEDTDNELKTGIDAKQSIVVIDTYTAWLLGTLDLLEATQVVFPNLTIPASSLDEFSEMIDRMGEAPAGHKSMSAQDDGFVINEYSASEVAVQSNEIRDLRDQIASTTNVVGIEVPSDVRPEFIRMADFMGSQFDCLSVVQREDGILLSADLRLRQISTAICEKKAFGMDALLRILAAEQAISVEAYADALLKLCGHGHSYVALNSLILMRMLMVDETPDLHRLELAAAHIGTPNADIASHIVTASEFARRAFLHYGNGLKAQRATGIVLRKLIRMKGISLPQILNTFGREAASPSIMNYVSQWLHGHFLMETYEQKIESDKDQ